jgi:hypothetical protein
MTDDDPRRSDDGSATERPEGDAGARAADESGARAAEEVPLDDLARRVAARRGAADDDPRDAGRGDPAASAPASDASGPSRSTPDRSESPDDVAPLSDLARRVGERRTSRSTDADDRFDEVRVGEVDEETLWASLADPDAADAAHVGANATAERVHEDIPGYDDHVVPKDAFCGRCPHLAPPPELACEHEGTEIVEVVDSERFLVRNCPMIDADDR